MRELFLPHLHVQNRLKDGLQGCFGLLLRDTGFETSYDAHPPAAACVQAEHRSPSRLRYLVPHRDRNTNFRRQADLESVETFGTHSDDGKGRAIDDDGVS